LSTFPISQVYPKILFCIRRCFLCLNPVSAHTVCLAWYIVKERFAALSEAAHSTALAFCVKPFGEIFSDSKHLLLATSLSASSVGRILEI
ncbi:hypothetical protein NC713_06735, partial [Pseudidiomarina andamanensis]|uniref:hypothetical protein n=1 Tax=Pseudidiomarina andamanensis TaxID=1940690 RepID=UPI0028741242